jgi:hypothetical protein
MAALRSVLLDEQLCHAAEMKFGQRFGTIEELLHSVLQELLREDALTLDADEQRVIEERLRGLGYI